MAALSVAGTGIWYNKKFSELVLNTKINLRIITKT